LRSEVVVHQPACATEKHGHQAVEAGHFKDERRDDGEDNQGRNHVGECNTVTATDRETLHRLLGQLASVLERLREVLARQ
jgi:hypothetical protein